MDNNSIKLNQLSRFLFNEAANAFYLAIVIELVIGTAMVVFNFIDFSDTTILIILLVSVNLSL